MLTLRKSRGGKLQSFFLYQFTLDAKSANLPANLICSDTQCDVQQQQRQCSTRHRTTTNHPNEPRWIFHRIWIIIMPHTGDKTGRVRLSFPLDMEGVEEIKGNTKRASVGLPDRTVDNLDVHKTWVCWCCVLCLLCILAVVDDYIIVEHCRGWCLPLFALFVDKNGLNLS
jgi:hypothetical protein